MQILKTTRVSNYIVSRSGYFETYRLFLLNNQYPFYICGGVWVVPPAAPKQHTVLHTVLHITYLYVLKIHVELRIPLTCKKV